MYAKEMNITEYPKHIKQYLEDRGISEDLARQCKLYSEPSKYANQKDNLVFPYYSKNKEFIKNQRRIFNHSTIKFLNEKNQRNHPYLVPFKDWENIFDDPSKELILTEGETRAINLCSHGLNAISFSGCHNFKTKIDGISRFLPELEEIKWISEHGQPRSVGICYDADIINNPLIQNAVKDLAQYVFRKGGIPYYILIPVENGKDGLDDFIVKHGFEAFEEIRECSKNLRQKGKGYFIKEKRIKDLETEEYTNVLRFDNLEPHENLKGVITWAILKEDWEFRPSLGWYHWNGKFWDTPKDKDGADQVESDINRIINDQKWIENSLRKCSEQFFLKKKNLLLLNRKWNNPDFLGFNDGCLNLKTKQFIKHDRKHYLTDILPFNYNDSEKCPKWMEFINFVFNGDQQKINYLRAWMRWILTPKKNDRDFPIEATLWIVGKPKYGKSTFFSVLEGLCGEKNIGSIAPYNMDDPKSLFSCFEKKLTLNHDCSGRLKNTDIYNKIASNQPVPIHKFFVQPSSQRLNSVIVFGMNNEISFNPENAEGFARRVHAIYFKRKPEKINPFLKEQLQQELSAIFKWVWELSLEETIKLLENRINDDVNEVLENSRPEFTFLKETGCHNGEFQASFLYQEFLEWCDENGYKSHVRFTSIRKFSKLLKQIEGVKHIKKNTGSFYFIPDLNNKNLFDNSSQLELLQQVKNDVEDTKKMVDSGGRCKPSSVKVVQEVVDNNIPLKKNILTKEEKNKKTFNLSSTSTTNLENKEFKSSTDSTTTSTTEREKNQFCYIDEIQHLPSDVVEVFNTAKNVVELNSQLGGKVKELRKKLNKSKDWIEQKFWDKFKSNFNSKSAYYDPIKLGEFIQYLRKMPVLLNSKEKEELKLQKQTEKPRQPKFDLRDVKQFLQKGTGKHKSNYVCPCCEKDYLSINVHKGFKCWNPNSNCDTKEIYKEFIEILKNNDLKWQLYQRQYNDWLEGFKKLNGGDDKA